MSIMEKLILYSRGTKTLLRSVGVFWLILAIFNAVFTIIDFKLWTLFGSIIDLVLGVGFITLLFGTVRDKIEKVGDTIHIRWHTRLREKIIQITDISEITGNDYMIYIEMHNGKPIKLDATALEFDEHRAVVKFLRDVTGKNRLLSDI